MRHSKRYYEACGRVMSDVIERGDMRLSDVAKLLKPWVVAELTRRHDEQWVRDLEEKETAEEKSSSDDSGETK